MASKAVERSPVWIGVHLEGEGEELNGSAADVLAGDRIPVGGPDLRSPRLRPLLISGPTWRNGFIGPWEAGTSSTLTC